MAKLYLVQVKSDAIKNDGANALLIPMEFDNEGKRLKKKEIHDALIRDAIKLYPQYTNIASNPIFTISRMTQHEFKQWQKTNVYEQKSLSRGV